ncbi:CMGC/DYRK/DYRK2 protein kinase [Coprinopsis cinerea okayama7|uniref:dual-specificity kinase n=1 Tax=Coprinopsis cinerea (strain Okayama-7 / 130 / ATCC MYA-4618 / FGSC 9003) TaxID=240176 RepID=D6RKY7_COPC7|nr:CMGC/DYRK/DYRK2 protein kinase [Coprinopsis cinerea okayama7\|eukprot:XP_002911917.1 CMGC/DYRK/DYRK2 protein kinase [Coprinopsis cinerea okayama7\
MSASPDPPQQYKARPAALAIHDDEGTQPSDGDDQIDNCQHQHLLQPLTINVSHQDNDDSNHSRSTSVTSSLDPYYFGLAESPEHNPNQLSITPDHPPPNEPVTPARNPASIDRRGLVGVGELATPRWTRDPSPDPHLDDDVPPLPDRPEDDAPDSPWTIEAIDGELSDSDEVSAPAPFPASNNVLIFLKVKIPELPPPARPLRTRPSIADESGGEEILYPRNVIQSVPDHPPPTVVPPLDDHIPKQPRTPASADPPISSPPSAFSSSTRKARKRTSDEFELDQTGALVSKRGSLKEKSRDDARASIRKHRSLNVSTSSSTSPRDSKTRERKRESIGLGLAISSSVVSPRLAERHSRQASSSSVSSPSSEPAPARRVHTTDFSHLPPSPSSSSIQQFLRQTIPKEPPSLHSPPNVAHSLLRGTQEGWSGLDDEATAEALRKLDGLTGKTARSRASMTSLGRGSSASRPGTPAKSSQQWEGISGSESVRSKRISTFIREGGKEPRSTPNPSEGALDSDYVAVSVSGAISSDEPHIIQDKTPKKQSRLSFTPKRGSTSSTTYGSTPTTSSRDSAGTATTNATSVSATSGGRVSSTKARRNSAGSDVSSVHSNDLTLLKDRAAHLAATGELIDDAHVPPVPPLPKDLSSYRSPPTTSSTQTFRSIPSVEDPDIRISQDSDIERAFSSDVSAGKGPRVGSSATRQSQANPNTSEAVPIVKTPSKKWSFSSALNLKLASSPSSSSTKSSFPLSPRSVGFGHGLRKSSSKEQTSSASSSKAPWSPEQPDAMASAGSLASLSSLGSVRNHSLHPDTSKTPDKNRPGTGSSVSTAGLSAPSGPLSPSASIKRAQSKRLTPSSIPFFRRSSSQSMQVPSSSGSGHPSSPPPSMPTKASRSKASTPPHDISMTSVSTPGKKASVLSLGLPSLLKSSSRRSLHSDAKEAAKELQKAKEAARESDREKAKAEKAEKERQKKEDKDRSESRISVLISRKRGKTLSATDPRKPKSPVTLPPMQISAIEPVTAQRVAKLKSSSSQSTTSSINSRTSSSSSRVTSQTASSMQKISDSSLRSRTQLPTIAGSPSVGTNGTNSTQNTIREKDHSSLLSSSISGLPKETPTKIPRISSRTSAAPSPSGKSTSTFASRRTSMNPAASSSTNPSPISLSTNEFGVIDNEDGATPRNLARQSSIRASPSTSASRPARQSSANTSSTSSSALRKSTRESVSFIGLRKASTSSVNSTSTPGTSGTTSESSGSHRFSALSPSKGLKLLGPKSSRSAASSSQNLRQNMSSPSSSRQSLSTPSPVPSTVDEDELLGDEEMMNYIRRQQAKKKAAGATQEELEEMLKFPEPTPPVPPASPHHVLKSSQAQYLSDYERKEILDYPSVYFIGAKSRKKMATPDITTNNYSYDDERGDYQVVLGDHLAYRYEVVDTLGKGSFGQVLNCRDHCTGESVAVKIIRNKKRFHHQALVEIKILDNLRKWDADEKHHVLKMTEHFYFRNHLCIATELLSINLYELIKANGFVGFTTALIRRFTTQMLMSLSLMRHHRIVHCDLKPENVLLRHPAKSAIKVIDFGSSCLEHEKTELYTGFPIFPGENEQEQLSCIMEVLGVPDKEYINRSSRKKLFFDTNGAPRPVVNSKGRRRRPGSKTLAQVLRCNDEEFIDFIAKCLVWDPERRMKPQAAMRHPFVTAGKRKAQQQAAARATPSSSSLSSHRSKHITETPKKSMIGAPTPLTARTPRSSHTSGVPNTPGSSSHTSSFGSSTRSYRTSQGHSLSSSVHSSRVMNGYSSTASTK